MNKLIKKVQEAFAVSASDIPAIHPGDMINVHAKVVEKNKERIQQFQGTIIRIRGQKAYLRKVTVRKLSGGIAIERMFTVPSPNVTKVEVKRKAKSRRAKLYYLRDIEGEIKTKIKYKVN